MMSIVMLNRAVSYSEEPEVDFLQRSFTDSHLAGTKHDQLDDEFCYKVDVITLNDIVVDYFSAEKTYVLISDIEGAEADIFEFDKESLTKCKRIITELENTHSHTIDQQVTCLKSAGFCIKEYYGNVYVFDKMVLNK